MGERKEEPLKRYGCIIDVFNIRRNNRSTFRSRNISNSNVISIDELTLNSLAQNFENEGIFFVSKLNENNTWLMFGIHRAISPKPLFVIKQAGNSPSRRPANSSNRVKCSEFARENFCENFQIYNAEKYP